MLIVAGLSLKNLKPRVWDPVAVEHLPLLRAVMLSWAELSRMPTVQAAAEREGIRTHLGIPDGVHVYLDNGSFNQLMTKRSWNQSDYEYFISTAKPDWYPIPRDYIPVPVMPLDEQHRCFTRTLNMNRRYQHDGYVPVIHASQLLDHYVAAVRADSQLAAKPEIAIGGIVPNLLRSPRSRPYRDVLRSIREARKALAGKRIHLFGIGGTATLHIAALLGMDSVDSSGWRTRAARGLIQLPGTGDRTVADLGNWRGRRPSEVEWARLQGCMCPACCEHGIEGLTRDGIVGFCNRAVHNLWVLLEENRLIEHHLDAGTYLDWYPTHLDNTIYRPLIDFLIEDRLEASA